MKTKIFAVSAIALGVAFAGGAGVVTGIDKAYAGGHLKKEQVVKERREGMKQIGKNMGVIAGFLKKDEGTAEDVAKAASAIAALSAKIPAWFPEGTSLNDVKDPETGAKPVIWEKFGDFEAAAKVAEKEAMALASVAAGGDKGAIGGQFGKLGKNGCGGCHKPFREKLD